MFYYSTILLVLFYMPFSIAASGEGVPVTFILFQTLNFIIFFGIMWYLFLKKVPGFVLRQYDDYISMKNRAEDLYQKTKKNKEETEKKLSHIKKKETHFDEELHRELKKMEIKLNQDLIEQQNAVLRMAQNFIDQELIKIKSNLKSKFLNKVEALCRENLESEEQKTHLFVQKING